MGFCFSSQGLARRWCYIDMCFEEEAMLMSFVNSRSVEIDAQE
jgi:hypothetical protein